MNEIMTAVPADREELLALYQTMLHGPADWDEGYPGLKNIDTDISRGDLFVMKDDGGAIMAAISIDADAVTDVLPCWSPDLVPARELARVCVRGDLQRRGLAKQMVRHVAEVLRARGCRGMHLLVTRKHSAARKCYSDLGFREVGSCSYHNKDYVCMECAL